MKSACALLSDALLTGALLAGVLLSALLICGCGPSARTAGGLYGRPGGAERGAENTLFPAGRPELVALGDSGGLSLLGESVGYGPTDGNAVYTYRNDGAETLTAGFAFPYSGGLYRPDGIGVSCDGEDVAFDVVLDWEGSALDWEGSALDWGGSSLDWEGSSLDWGGAGHYAGARGHSVEWFDGDAKYALYVVVATRGTQKSERVDRVYIGADFTVDVSKTRIVADGFGYAANPYGAVRIWSLSDGFDTGIERRLFIIGDDIDINIKAFEDADLTTETRAVHIEVERRDITVREYLLAYSAPYAMSLPDGYDPDVNEGAGSPSAPDLPRSARPTDVYGESLYRVYARALDELLAVHYFIPRGALFANAETRRNNAVLFEIEFPAGATRTIDIKFPY